MSIYLLYTQGLQIATNARISLILFFFLLLLLYLNSFSRFCDILKKHNFFIIINKYKTCFLETLSSCENLFIFKIYDMAICLNFQHHQFYYHFFVHAHIWHQSHNNNNIINFKWNTHLFIFKSYYMAMCLNFQSSIINFIMKKYMIEIY